MSISLRNRISILRRDGYRCVYCGNSSAEARLHVDHVVPESRGGLSHWTNLVTSCASCNLGKSDQEMPLPDGFELTEPTGWHGRPFGRRRLQGPATPNEPGRTDPLQSGSLGFCTDACEGCARLSSMGRHLGARESGCFACLPMSLHEAPRGSFLMGYRCRCGHEWQTGWDWEEAFRHSTASRRELARTGYPYHPMPA